MADRVFTATIEVKKCETKEKHYNITVKDPPDVGEEYPMKWINIRKSLTGSDSFKTAGFKAVVEIEQSEYNDKPSYWVKGWTPIVADGGAAAVSQTGNTPAAGNASFEKQFCIDKALEICFVHKPKKDSESINDAVGRVLRVAGQLYGFFDVGVKMAQLKDEAKRLGLTDDDPAGRADTDRASRGENAAADQAADEYAAANDDDDDIPF